VDKWHREGVEFILLLNVKQVFSETSFFQAITCTGTNKQKTKHPKPNKYSYPIYNKQTQENTNLPVSKSTSKDGA